MGFFARLGRLYPYCLAIMVVVYGQVFAGETTIRIEEPAGLARKSWPVDLGFPFSRGELKDTETIGIYAPDGSPVPVQTKVLATWPDGSIRWAHVLFMADMKPQTVDTWRMVWGGKKITAGEGGHVTARMEKGTVRVDTGPLRIALSGKGFRLFDSIELNGKTLSAPFCPEGFRIITDDGAVYDTAHDTSASLSIEEAGPLRAIVRAEGVHRAENGKTLFDYTCRVYFYAGKPWCEVEYGFTNREQPDSVDVVSISLVTTLPGESGRFRGATSEYKIDKFWDFDEPFSIYSGSHDYFGVFGGAVMYRRDGSEITGMGYESEARSRWWVDSSDGSRGLTVSIRDMSQNFPKKIRAYPDSVVVDLYPAGESSPLSFHQGWSKTHTMLMYFHEGDARKAGSRELCFSWQAPMIPWSPRHIESGCLGDIFPYSPQKYPMIERSLRTGFIAYEGGVGIGMIDYGDTRGSGSGERGNFWQNNAFDVPWVSYLLFLRDGECRYWTRARSSALHSADIDIVHFSTKTPVEIGGIRIHGPNHVQYNAEAIMGTSVAPNHEWVEGLLMTYHLTGEKRYYDLAVGMADHILRAIDAGWILPPYNAKWNGARNLGWPLLICTVMYDETGDNRYLEGARRIVKGLKEIQLENGSFPITIGPYVAAAPLHNTIVMEALGRYHALTGDGEAREILMRCIDSTLDDLRFPDGEFIYITHPDYRSGYTSMQWGGFHYGYLFTGDTKYLDAPYPLIMSQLKSRNFGVYGEGALSYPLRGMLFYLNYADKAGILRDIPEY
ncbi:hypothetical protein LLG96_13705 [bacterium]|nr:hypothetical protein [bacterium]